MIAIGTLASLLTPIEMVMRGPSDPRTIICVVLSLVCAFGLVFTRITGKARLSSAFTHTAFTAATIVCYGYIDPTLAVLVSIIAGLQAMLLAGNAVGWAVLLTLTATHILHRGLPAYLDGSAETLIAVGLTSGVCIVMGGVVTVVSGRHTRMLQTHHEQRIALEHALARAEEASAVKSSFLANTSHEVRTPMNGVLGLLEVMEGTPLSTDQRMLLDTARRSAVGLLGILDGILDLSKLDAGQFQLQPQPCNVGDIVRDATQLLSSNAKAGVSVTSHVGTIPTWVRLDDLRVRQVVMNLLSNAVKFTEQGSVHIDVEHADGILTLHVRDTGIGMSADQLRRVFEPFQQADSSTSRVYGGTGLGLTISRRLVHLMGGDITAESTIDRGTTFRVTMPAAPCAPPESTTVGRSDHALRVLVVDDDPVNRLVAQRMIETSGHEVHLAGDGAAAVQAVQRIDFDLVLMDREMPRMDGIEATRAIRSLTTAAARVPIVALTASAMVDDQRECLDAGMDAVLTKPYTLDRMGTLIATIAAKQALAG